MTTQGCQTASDYCAESTPRIVHRRLLRDALTCRVTPRKRRGKRRRKQQQRRVTIAVQTAPFVLYPLIVPRLNEWSIILAGFGYTLAVIRRMLSAMSSLRAPNYQRHLSWLEYRCFLPFPFLSLLPLASSSSSCIRSFITYNRSCHFG